MIGQGRPDWRYCWLLPVALAVCAVVSGAEPIDVRIRIAWGGGEAKPWQGTIGISEGKLSEVKPLGLEADSPGSIIPLNEATIRISGRTPRSYDGCDVRVIAPSGARLIVQLAADPAEMPRSAELPLEKIVRDFLQFDLDDKSNRLLAQRSPGDALRVSFAAPSLVFGPGEKFELEVKPQQLELSPNGNYVLSANLGAARTEESTWTEDYEFRADGAGGATAIGISAPLPLKEGVYDLRLSLYPKRLTSTLVRGKAIATRKVQLVVAAPVQTAGPPPAAWQSVLEFDPASPKWWERMARLPSWTGLPTVPRPVESGPAGTRTHLGREWVELSKRAWQAYPLSIGAPGAPHQLEIQYPSDVEQTLGISIIEPNAAGYVGPIGLDSGVDVPRPEAGHRAGVGKHRLTFWPQTRTPYVLLVNRRDDGPALFGKIDVQAGPVTLPPLAIGPANFATRMLAAYYDQPLLVENFSGSEAVDPISRRGLDDWVTFSAAGQRMVETLQHGGFNAVVLTAACEGSAIYPSQILGPTPRYDSGEFFESGQDPVRKDVLELLFRLCDRSGVVLIPAVQFGGPIPSLEALRLSGEAEAAGLDPVGPDGRTWVARNGGSGSGVYYNALDDRVQRAMKAAVAELAERYGQHASFGGVAVHLSAESYALLPDETCSLDDVTFERFLKETKSELPQWNAPLPSAESRIAARWEFIRRSAAQPWLAWRTQKLTGLYRQMRDEVVRRRSGAKLYLTTANLFSGRQLQTALRPELPARGGAAEILPLLGLDLNRLEDKDIVVPRPQRILPSSAGLARDQEQHWNRHASLDALFARAAKGSALNFLAPTSLRLPQFDAASPFGADKTRTLLLSQIVPADAANRERFVDSLARLDATLIIDGGWLLPLGQEAALAPLAKVYRRLPAEPFETAPAAGQSQELVVRTLGRGEKTYFYAVNPTPWPLTAEIQFAGPPAMRLTPYCDERQANLRQAEGGVTWIVEMEPFDLVGGELSAGKARFVKCEVVAPPGVGQMLADQSREVARRANYLRDNPRRIGVVNASFENRVADGSVTGWVHAPGAESSVRVDPTQGSGSARSLHLVNRAVGSAVWVRSTPFATPTTGRIKMTAQVRVADAAQQPQLRLAIEGKQDGKVYYRRETFGSIEREGEGPAVPLGTDWTKCSIAVTNLPFAGLTELRVGFDLMSPGEVWIDDVQVEDLWLQDGQDGEYSDLIKSAPTAILQAQSGRLNECRLFVEGYWPSFLRKNVQLPDSREAAPKAVDAAAAPRPGALGVRPKLPPISLPIPGRRSENSAPPRAAEREKGWWPGWMRWR